MTRAFKYIITAALALTAATAAFAGGIEPGDHLEMAAVLKAQVSPTRAVQIAEAGGGHAFTYGMEANRHGHWYEVSVLRGGAKLLLKINAENGRVIGSRAARGEDAQGAHALDGSKLAFGDAIAQAERAGGGPALEANAAGHGDKAWVDVDVIQDQGKQIAHYKVSLHNGQIQTQKTGVDA
ncbi:MAG: hypothetical protein OJF55_002105 [Rhodanobacteraceae bacterium]|jgi:hypothetical protein|nr:MAG: hypothetical protein OJF55_002105 [Rhodanobacteraceae bacterium]